MSTAALSTRGRRRSPVTRTALGWGAGSRGSRGRDKRSSARRHSCPEALAVANLPRPSRGPQCGAVTAPRGRGRAGGQRGAAGAGFSGRGPAWKGPQAGKGREPGAAGGLAHLSRSAQGRPGRAGPGPAGPFHTPEGSGAGGAHTRVPAVRVCATPGLKAAGSAVTGTVPQPGKRLLWCTSHLPVTGSKFLSAPGRAGELSAPQSAGRLRPLVVLKADRKKEKYLCHNLDGNRV